MRAALGGNLCPAAVGTLDAHAFLEGIADRLLVPRRPSAVRIREDRTGLVDFDLS